MSTSPASTSPTDPSTCGIARPRTRRPRPARIALRTSSQLLVAAILATLPLEAQPPAESEPLQAAEPAPASQETADRTPAPLPTPASSRALVASEPVVLMVWNRPVATFRASYNDVTAAERAASAQARIEALPLHALTGPVSSQRVSDGRQTGELIQGGGSVLFVVLEADLDATAGETLESAAADAVRQLRAIFDARLEQRRPTVMLRAAGFAVASIALLAAALVAALRLRRRAFARLDGIAQRTLPVAGFDLWPFVMGFGRGVLSIASGGLVLVTGYLLLTVTLRQLPYTRPWGDRLGGWVVDLLRGLGLGLIGAVPGLTVVVLIYFATRFVARTVDALLERAKSEDSPSVWLHPDTVEATRRIARIFIWLFAIVVAYPYIPGSSTTAFKGVSVFAGLMLSLGSSGLVNQILSGFLLTYSRALRQGDLVRVGDTFGVVSEVGVLSTKLMTPRQEFITIPNTVMVSSSVVNYVRADALLSTSVTIGYDAPWRQVHSMLLLAAERTPGIRPEPKPVVLQRSLSDFYVEYELRCGLERQLDRMKVLSRLHGEIQDAFNQYGVQIMSPHFEGQPDRPVLAPPESWYAAPARAPGTAPPPDPPNQGGS